MEYDTIIRVDCGEDVLCDLCNDNFTESEEVGGCLVGSYALCPKCAGEFKEAPDEWAKENETFRDFVHRIRKRQ